MIRTELLEMIANGENSGVEFKRDTVLRRAKALGGTGNIKNKEAIPPVGASLYASLTDFQRQIIGFIGAIALIPSIGLSRTQRV